ncbi:MAG: hypothetical protein Kow0068_02770 [Marinilabiliales bacterium]
MKKIILLFAGIIFISIAYSQIIEDENGVYYDQNKNLYNGTYIEFYDNGNKKIEINIVDGYKDGQTFLYFPDGTLNEIRSYKKGKMDGTWTTFNKEGKKTAIANYTDNKKDGKWIIWDDNGVKRYEMEYKEGKRSGIWTMWNENGEQVNQYNYDK